MAHPHPKPNPRLRGELVYLRPIEPADAEIVHAWYEDGETARLMGELPKSLARRRRDLEAGPADAGEDWFSFVICRIADGRPVGRADVFEVSRIDGSAAFGLTIASENRRQGLGRDAVDVIVDFCFGQLRLHRVWLATDSENGAARRVYERAGFVHEGRLRRAYYQDGRFQDEIRMAMLRPEWEALPRRRSWEHPVPGLAGSDRA